MIVLISLCYSTGHSLCFLIRTLAKGGFSKPAQLAAQLEAALASQNAAGPLSTRPWGVPHIQGTCEQNTSH
jgi:hypothetical protein